MYIDKKHGRNKIKDLFTYDQKEKILHVPGTTEINLLSGWKEYMLTSPGHQNLPGILTGDQFASSHFPQFCRILKDEN